MTALRIPEIKHGNKSLGELHALLKKTFPQFRNKRGGLDVAALADHLEYSFQAVYLWFQADNLTPTTAAHIVARSGGRLKLEQLARFVYPIS